MEPEKEFTKMKNHRAQPGVTDNDHSCHGLCCAHSAPAAAMSDLKRSAKMKIPDPVRSYIFKFPDEALIDVVYSRDGHSRAFISEMKNGGIRLRIEIWMYWDYAGKEEWFWKDCDQHAHVLDSVDRAKEIAMSRFDKGVIE
jgi:hypothetical protein